MYTPEFKELTLRIDSRMIAALKQLAITSMICGNSLGLAEKLMFSIAKAIDENKNDLTLEFKSDNPNFRGT